MDDPIFDPWAIRKPDSGESEKIEHGGRRQSGVTEPASGETRTLTPARASVVRRWVVPASRVTPSEAPAPARWVGRIESEQTIAERLGRIDARCSGAAACLEELAEPVLHPMLLLPEVFLAIARFLVDGRRRVIARPLPRH